MPGERPDLVFTYRNGFGLINSGLVEYVTDIQGDMDGNGVADAWDVDDFELAVVDADLYAATHPGIVAVEIADFDDDGVVDAADLEIFRLTSLPSDLTGNGFVDADDLFVLLSNWDQDVSAVLGNLVNPDTTKINADDLFVLLSEWTGPDPAGSPEAALGAEAVPEPSGLVLALVATIGLSVGWRRRRRTA